MQTAASTRNLKQDAIKGRKAVSPRASWRKGPSCDRGDAGHPGPEMGRPAQGTLSAGVQQQWKELRFPERETRSADWAPRLHGPDGSEAPGPEVGASLRSVSGPSTSHTGVDVPSLGDRSWRAPLPTAERSFWASRYVGFPKNRNSLKLTFFAFFSRY